MEGPKVLNVWMKIGSNPEDINWFQAIFENYSTCYILKVQILPFQYT